MARCKRKTIPFSFGDKHKDYIRACRENTYNFAEGAVRAGKTIDNVFAFANELKRTKDKIHLASGSTLANAKLNIGDANGFGLEHIFRGQCRWGKYKDNEALIIKGESTNGKERIVIFAGASKADGFKKIRGNSYAMWIATEINLHHDSFIKEAINRTAAASVRKFFWDLNPDHPRATIYTDYIDKYREKSERGELIGGCNYQHFTIDDNINISEERKAEIKSQYDPSTVWYQRDILGRRVIAEGLIYRLFADDAKKYRISKDISKGKAYDVISIGVDFGGNKSKHTFVCTGITAGFRELVILKSEMHEPDDVESLEGLFVRFVRSVLSDYKRIDIAYADSAEQVLKRTLQKALDKAGIDLFIKNSIKNPIVDRIRATNTLIYENRLYLVEGETKTAQEALEMAVWDSKKIDPERLDDGTSDIDTLDALEYSFEKHIRRLVRLDVSKAG